MGSLESPSVQLKDKKSVQSSPEPHSEVVNPENSKHSFNPLKLPKDRANYIERAINGECRYPPHDTKGELCSEEQASFQMYPMGKIKEYPRLMPYSSVRQVLLNITGRQKFEVFQYEFSMPGSEEVYPMYWDYNIGLVRVANIFKCLGYTKNVPKNVIVQNPGLAELCPNITGGLIASQGYWVPFEAAKALAARFCWKIRYALAPMFGPDFPILCVRPDSPDFERMIIDPAIIACCAEQTRLYRKLEPAVASRPKPAAKCPLTPSTPSHPYRPSPTLSQSSRGGEVAGYTSPPLSEGKIGTSRASRSTSYSPKLQDDVRAAHDTPVASKSVWNKAGDVSSQVRSSSRKQKFPSRTPLQSTKIAAKRLHSQTSSTIDHDDDDDYEKERRKRTISHRSHKRACLSEPALSDEEAAHILLSMRSRNINFGSKA